MIGQKIVSGLALAGVLAGTPVYAATISQDVTFSFDSASGSIAENVATTTFSAFNPAVGTLNSVTAVLPVRASETITPGDTSPSVGANVLLQLQTPVSFTVIPAVLSFLYLSSPGSVSQHLGLGTVLTGATADEFEGTGSISLPVLINYFVSFGTPVDFSVISTSTGKVTYNYTLSTSIPGVPEPGTLALLAIPLLAVGTARFRRR